MKTPNFTPAELIAMITKQVFPNNTGSTARSSDTDIPSQANETGKEDIGGNWELSKVEANKDQYGH